MRAIESDFSPVRARWWVRPRLATLTLLSTAMLQWMSMTVRDSAERDHEQMSQRLMSHQDTSSRPVSPPQSSNGAHPRAWREERIFPWVDALRVIERVEMPGIQLQSYEAEAATGVIRIVLDAPGHEAVASYASALNAGQPVNDARALRWHITSSIADTDAGRHVRATVEYGPR